MKSLNVPLMVCADQTEVRMLVFSEFCPDGLFGEIILWRWRSFRFLIEMNSMLAKDETRLEIILQGSM